MPRDLIEDPSDPIVEEAASTTKTEASDTPAPVEPNEPAEQAGQAAEPAGGEGAAPAVSDADEPEFVSIRDVAKERGFDPATWDDDEAAANQLADDALAYRRMQADPNYELFQRMGPQFQAWLQNPAAQAPAASPPSKPESKWYTPPEFDQRWLADLEVDEQGNLKPKAGRTVSPERIGKVAQYIQWREEVQRKFLDNPQAAVEEMVAGQVAETARKLATEQMQDLSLRQQAGSFVERNAQWLFRHNDAGQRLVDPITRQPVLTREGQLFRHYLDEASKLGITELGALQDYALRMVERELMHQQLTSGSKAPAEPAPVKQAIERASKSPKRSAARAQVNTPNRTGPSPKAALGEQLLTALREAGIKDDDIQ